VGKEKNKTMTNETNQTVATEQTPGKFKHDGPGGFGHNQCAKCLTKVDINGLDLDNRKHFNVDGSCVGFARMDVLSHRELFLERDRLSSEQLKVLLKFTESLGVDFLITAGCESLLVKISEPPFYAR
jgi:hypothetical protein